MKTLLYYSLLLLPIIAIFPQVFAQNQESQRIIIRLDDATPLAPKQLKNGTLLFGTPSLDSLQKVYGCTQVEGLHRLRNTLTKRNNTTQTPLLLTLTFGKSHSIKTLCQAYEALPEVLYAEPDYLGEGGGKRFTPQALPNDSLFSRQWGLKNDGSFNRAPQTAKPGADINIEAVWNATQGSPTITLAILDSGIKPDHPEFENRIWVNTAETPENGIDDDGNGYIDDTQGWNFAYDDNDITDDHGHGTNVAGIAAATGNNNLGYAGVDWNAKILVCKVLNEENKGFYSWWIDAILYAVDQGADVINLSLGGDSFSQGLRDAVQYAIDNDVFVVACMMNENTDEPYYPAAYQGVFAVGATNPNDTRASPFFWDEESGSNYGSHINLVAPGNFIYGLSHLDNNNYGTYWGGTSQAAPYVAGVASLVRAAQPSLTIAEITEAMHNTAEDRIGFAGEDTPGFDIYYGHGRLNAEALFNLLGITSTHTPLNTTLSEFEVYPNPTQSYIQFANFPMHDTAPVALKLIDMQGKTITEWKLTPKDLQKPLALPSTPSGYYFLLVTHNYLQKNVPILIK